ncbi:MAG: thiamine diphosphokinase [Fimbriimonadaceae bacterium]|nr:thiamine diphosphokinase [Fimbriimonadaceae bacterium]
MIRVLAVLNGADLETSQLLAWADQADAVYAADGGANRLLASGRSPVVVGDLDSVDPSLLGRASEVVRIHDQDRTDCDKLLDHIQAAGHSAAVVTGLEGDRLDHTLAALQSMVGRPLTLGLRLRRMAGRIIRPGEEVHPSCRAGSALSLIPLTACSGVEMRGVRWPLQAAELTPGRSLSISNESLDRPSVLVAEGTAACLWTVDPEEACFP